MQSYAKLRKGAKLADSFSKARRGLLRGEHIHGIAGDALLYTSAVLVALLRQPR